MWTFYMHGFPSHFIYTRMDIYIWKWEKDSRRQYKKNSFITLQSVVCFQSHFLVDLQWTLDCLNSLLLKLRQINYRFVCFSSQRNCFFFSLHSKISQFSNKWLLRIGLGNNNNNLTEWMKVDAIKQLSRRTNKELN